MQEEGDGRCIPLTTSQPSINVVFNQVVKRNSAIKVTHICSEAGDDKRREKNLQRRQRHKYSHLSLPVTDDSTDMVLHDADKSFIIKISRRDPGWKLAGPDGVVALVVKG